MEYSSITQMVEKWGIKQRRIRKLCEQGRIPGAFKMGSYWSIPSEEKKPLDRRIKTGKYIQLKNRKDSI